MSSSKIWTGKTGENLACQYLEKKGYRVLQRNFKCRYEEIDIIGIDGSILAFVEVKTRTSYQFGTPFESITPWKLQRVIKAAQFYKVTHKNTPDAMRIDAVSVMLDRNNEVEKIELMKNISGF